jgi:hypothetical protein
MTTKQNGQVVLLTSVPNEMVAGIVVGGLEGRGIKATMSGVYTSGFRAEAPGWVQILVAEEDLAAAQTVLDEVRSGGEEIDWSEVDVGMPADE